MKSINEYLLGRNTKFHQISQETIDHENDMIDLSSGTKSYNYFLKWFKQAIYEYEDLTKEEIESYKTHINYDGYVAIGVNNDKNFVDANLNINNMTYKKAYNKIVKFIYKIISMNK